METQFLVDEANIVAAHDRLFASDEDLTNHIDTINAALNLLSRVPVLHHERSFEELAILRLAIRCFNSGAASLKLLRCGYFQPAMAMVRDLVEIDFLLSLFAKDPQSLRDWLNMSEKDRRKNFKPFMVRQRLDAIDGYSEKKRRAAYDLLNQHAAHANPVSHHLISPDGMTQIGPFSDYKLLRMGVEELVKYLCHVSITFSGLIQSDTPEVLREKAALIAALRLWYDKYLSPTPSTDPAKNSGKSEAPPQQG